MVTRFKVDAKGSAANALTLLIGNGFPSHVMLRSFDDTALGTRGATNVTDGVTLGAYDDATRTLDISAITGKAVTNGQTFLDGVSVNGYARGYNGTPELLSFVATNAVQAAFFGYYGGGDPANGNKNRERLGEIILFETALSDGTRAGIEAYLMKKWLGKARAGYSDATAATVAGSGTVTAALPQQLPALSETFTGTVALSGTAFDFTLTTNAVGAHVVTPSISVPGSLAVAAAGTVYVHFTVKPPAGTYPLITCGATAGEGFANWALATDGDLPAGTVSLKLTATALNLSVASSGTLFMLQ
jgi:hypothetical protein